MSDEAGTVRLERRDATVFLTFDRPRARNAMTWAMYESLAALLARLDPGDGVRVAVLRGAGGTFVAGSDIAQFAAFESSDDGVAYERRLDAVIARLEAVPVPTVAVVEGFAAGAGLAIAAACDLRVCTPDAKFGVPIARTVGNCLSMANYARLVAHLGPARTTALLCTAGFMSAPEAREAGFVLEVVPPDQIDARVHELSERIASLAPITLQVSKQAIRRIVAGLGAEGEDLIRLSYGSRDFREGVAAFLAKRVPVWQGK
jgi:enoyl-CoA hydratase/carnithine racemase